MRKYFFFLFALMVVGCGGGAQPADTAPSPSAAPAPAPVDPNTAGIVAGTVSFEGEIPELPRLATRPGTRRRFLIRLAVTSLRVLHGLPAITHGPFDPALFLRAAGRERKTLPAVYYNEKSDVIYTENDVFYGYVRAGYVGR